jgi:hypothetical protein
LNAGEETVTESSSECDRLLRCHVSLDNVRDLKRSKVRLKAFLLRQDVPAVTEQSERLRRLETELQAAVKTWRLSPVESAHRVEGAAAAQPALPTAERAGQAREPGRRGHRSRDGGIRLGHRADRANRVVIQEHGGDGVDEC